MTTGLVRDRVAAGRGGWVPRGLVGPTSDELRTVCADAGWCFTEVSLAGVTDKKELLSTLAQQLDFPDHFGHNWDAVADCLADLAPQAPGVVLRLRGLWRIPEGLVDPLVEVLDERVGAAIGREDLAAGHPLVGEGMSDGDAAHASPPMIIVADPPLPVRG